MEGVNNSCFLLHIYQQLYKNQQKPDPFSGSCRVQLVTRDLALQEALNSSHVALPVQCGFEDFMRVGQLLRLVRLEQTVGGGLKVLLDPYTSVHMLQLFNLSIIPLSIPGD